MANIAEVQNLGEFQRALDAALIELSEDDAKKLVKKIIFDALRGFVLGTRVDTGRARGGWQVSRNTAVRSSDRLDKTGTAVLNQGLSQLAGMDISQDTIFIQNNVVYIGILENLDHMVENTLRRLTSTLNSGRL